MHPEPTDWSVEPERVREFARAVEAVRADLDAIARAVDDPRYPPMLGTSPAGRQLAAKFTDRMTGDHGLRGQLTAALARIEEFVAGAELTATRYQRVDEDIAAGMGFAG